MRRLFERFIRNFFRREQSTFAVTRSSVLWEKTGGAVESLRLLPGMHTDTTLTSPSSVVVIETKFVPEALQEYMGKKSLRSAHLYQLFAYLQNVAARLEPGRTLSGILLYPTVDIVVDAQFELHGHRVRAYTVNLNQPWQSIRRDLLSLVLSSSQPLSLN
jgi:5-methylcytosine-specific restriction enzyme subunit McrC